MWLQLPDIAGQKSMSKIADAFKNGKAFIPFLTGGDPTLDVSKEIILEMQAQGADLIEIGIPFSDPIAEGPVIQEANERALSAGCTTDKLFDMLLSIKDQMKVPMVFLTYVNPIFTYGPEKFMTRCNECGISGVIVPDLPFEEKGEIADVCKAHDIDMISLIAPTSNDRIKMIAKEATGYIYCVSSMGVTGVRNEITTDIAGMVSLVREVTDVPVAIGFGISTPEQAQKMASVSDGAIVGSAIVKLIGANGADSAAVVGKYVADMKAAVMKAQESLI